MRFVSPILLAAGAIWTLSFAINGDHSTSDRLELLLGPGFCCWLPLCLWILAIPITFSNKPRLVIDEKGITSNKFRKPKTILWHDIEKISFLWRRASYSYYLSIKLKNPQKYHSKITYFFLGLAANLFHHQGDYEIHFGSFDKDTLGAYWHIVELQRHKNIPSTLKIDRIADGDFAM